jgi:DNA-binding transcriptional ArsR family regulator
MHATRLAILAALEQEELTSGELATRVGVTRPMLSYHIAILASWGLVRCRPQGSLRRYSLAATEEESEAGPPEETPFAKAFKRLAAERGVPIRSETRSDRRVAGWAANPTPFTGDSR